MGQFRHFAVPILLIFAAGSLPTARADELPPAELASENVKQTFDENDASNAIDASAIIEDLDKHDADRSFHPTIRLRGRLDTDFLWVDQSALNRAVFGDLPDAFGLRRARLGAEGKLTPDARYIAEIDLAGGRVVLKDLASWIEDADGSGEKWLGHMREPFSLEMGTGANFFAFMERAAINALDPARNWGLGFTHYDASESWTLAAGIFQQGSDSSDLEFKAGSETAFTGRWTGLAWYEDEGRQLMHFGVALSERIPNQGVVIIKQRPQSSLLSFEDAVDTVFSPDIDIPADFQQLMNLQWAVGNGSLWAQSEWYGSWILSDQQGPVFYHGGYFNVGYFLTGEHRNYWKKQGVFGPVSVLHPAICHFAARDGEERALGHGAWELTARLAYLDFADPDTPQVTPGVPTGVRLPQGTVGVNWYLADRMRLMFNYTYSAPDEVVSGVSAASLWGMRVNVYW